MTRKLNQDALEHLFGCIRQMHGPYEHPNALDMKFRLKKLLLGKNVALLSEKTNVVTDNVDCLTTNEGQLLCNKDKTFSERELAVELYMTSKCFKDLGVGYELQYDVNPENEDVEHGCEAIDEVIEKESLRYIGGYIVKKFAVKYPDLGQKANICMSKDETWIERVNRGELYVPSEDFYSQLTTMREIFKTINGDSLKEGKGCFKKIISAIESVGVNLPSDVIAFFAKISVFFRMRKLNTDIRINKKKKKPRHAEVKEENIRKL